MVGSRDVKKLGFLNVVLKLLYKKKKKKNGKGKNSLSGAKKFKNESK
jgi:hypothetical protein